MISPFEVYEILMVGKSRADTQEDENPVRIIGEVRERILYAKHHGKHSGAHCGELGWKEGIARNGKNPGRNPRPDVRISARKSDRVSKDGQCFSEWIDGA